MRVIWIGAIGKIDYKRKKKGPRSAYKTQRGRTPQIRSSKPKSEGAKAASKSDPYSQWRQMQSLWTEAEKSIGFGQSGQYSVEPPTWLFSYTLEKNVLCWDWSHTNLSLAVLMEGSKQRWRVRDLDFLFESIRPSIPECVLGLTHANKFLPFA